MVSKRRTQSRFCHSRLEVDGTLVKALARAWRWQNLLDAGGYTLVSEIAQAEGISKSYVSRIFRLSLLAPEIWRRSFQEHGSGGDTGET